MWQMAKELSWIRSGLGLLLAGSCSVAALSCGSGADAPTEGDSTVAQPLNGNGQQINRVIPVRFIQLTSSPNTKLADSALQDDIDGANFIYAPAGLRFYLSANQEVTNSGAATFSSIDGSYCWPTPTSSASPLAAFNPSCSPPAPSGTGCAPGCTTCEPELAALFRMGAYCALEGEIVVFVAENAAQSEGAFPWHANAIQVTRGILNQPTWRSFSHELGHYLGLSHSFRGADQNADLGKCTVNPQTGVWGRVSDYWDLVYQPGATTASTRYFTSRTDAESVPLSSLRAIQGNAGWNYPTLPDLGFGCLAGGEARFTCPGRADGTFRLAVPKMAAVYSSCNADNDGNSCPCAVNPGQCDVLYTGDAGLKGLAFTMPGHTSSNPKLGVNIMSYNYDPAGVYLNDEFWLSASQLEQLQRTLKYDIGWLSPIAGCESNSGGVFTGAWGRRPWLGTGRGTWSNWESLGGATLGRPAVTASSAGQLDVIVRGTDNVAYNKVQNAGTTTWWPSQTGWASIGGSFTSPLNASRRGGYLDVVGRGSDSTILSKVWDPGLGAWWPSQTTFHSQGGSTYLVAPSIVSWGTDRIDLFTRSSANFYHKFWTSGTNWSPANGFTSIGAPSGVSSTPTACTWGTDRIDVIGLNSVGAAYNKVYQGSWWPSQTEWVSLGTREFSETPAIVTMTVNRLDVVGRGKDGNAYHKTWSPSGWSPSQTGWTNIGGPQGGSLAGPISLVSWGNGRLDMVARSSSNELLYKNWTSGVWWPSQTTWARLAVDIASDPVIVSSGSGNLDIFVRGSDGSLWHRSRRP